ncbi:uncharacterized protein [Asterias amurensis]|uniref:uncharacterized protein n=1 Tax=Asterias amurensis TaxID=7602 RepID=UPI003AB34EE1
MFLLKQLSVLKVVVMALGFLTGLLKESGQLESPMTPTLLQATGMQLQPEFADLMLLTSASSGPPPTSRQPIQQDHLSAGYDHSLQDFGRNMSLAGMFFGEDTPIETNLVTRVVPAEPALGYHPDVIPSLTTNLSTDHSMTAAASQRPPLIWVSPSTQILRHRVEHRRVSPRFQTSPDDRNETAPAELLFSTNLHPSTGVHPLDFTSRVTNLAPPELIPSSEGASASDHHLASWHPALSPDGRGITSSIQPEAMSAEPIMGSSLPTIDLWPDVMKALFEKCGWIFEQWAVGGNALINLSIFSSFLGVIMLLIQLLCKDHRHYRKTTLRPLRIHASNQRPHFAEVQLEFLRGAAAKRLILPLRTAFCLPMLPVIFLPSIGLSLLVWLLIRLWQAVYRRFFTVRSNTVNSLDAETGAAQASHQSPNLNNSNNGWGQKRSHLFNSFCDFFLGKSVDMETDEKEVEETMEIEADGDENMEVDEEVVSMETDEVDGLKKADEEMDVDLRPAETMEWEGILKIRGGWDSTGFHIEQDHVFIRQPLHKTSPCDKLKVSDMEWQGKADPHAASSSASTVTVKTSTSLATPASTMAPIPSAIPHPPPLRSPNRGPVEVSQGGDALTVPMADLLNSKAHSRTTIRRHPRRYSRLLRAKRDLLRRIADCRLKHRPYYSKLSQALWLLCPPIYVTTASAPSTGSKLVEDILRQWREKAMDNCTKYDSIPTTSSGSEVKQTYEQAKQERVNEPDLVTTRDSLSKHHDSGNIAPSDPINEIASEKCAKEGKTTLMKTEEKRGMAEQDDLVEKLKQVHITDKFDSKTTQNIKAIESVKITSETFTQHCNSGNIDKSDCAEVFSIERIRKSATEEEENGRTDDEELARKIKGLHITENENDHNKATELESNVARSNGESPIQHHISGNTASGNVNKSTCDGAHIKEGKTTSITTVDGQRTSVKDKEDTKTSEDEDLVRKFKTWRIPEDGCDLETEQGRVNETDSITTRETPIQHQCSNKEKITSQSIDDLDDLIKKLNSFKISEENECYLQTKLGRVNEPDSNTGQDTPTQHHCSNKEKTTSQSIEDLDDLIDKLTSWKISDENKCELKTEQGKANKPYSNQETPIKLQCSNKEKITSQSMEDLDDLIEKLKNWKLTDKETGCDLKTEQGKANKPGSKTTPETPIKHYCSNKEKITSQSIDDLDDLIRKLKSFNISEENECELQTKQGKVNKPGSDTTQETPIQLQCSAKKKITSDEDFAIRFKAWRIPEDGCDLQTEQGKANETDSITNQETPIQRQCSGEEKITSQIMEDLDDLIEKLKSFKISDENEKISQNEQNKAEDSGLNTTKLLNDVSYHHGNITTSEIINEGSLEVTVCDETKSNTIVSDEEILPHQGGCIASQIAEDKASINKDSIVALCKVSDIITTTIFNKKTGYQHPYTKTLPTIQVETSVGVDKEQISENHDSNTPTMIGKPSQCYGETAMKLKGACVEVDNEKVTPNHSDLSTTLCGETSNQQSENKKSSVILDELSVEADDEKMINEKPDFNTTVINDIPSYCHGDLIKPPMKEEDAPFESDNEKNTCEELDTTRTRTCEKTTYCNSDMTLSNTTQERAKFEGNINQENEKGQFLGTAPEQNVYETKVQDSSILISSPTKALETCTSKDELMKLMESSDMSEASQLGASNNHPLPSLSTLMLNTHGKGSRASRKELNFRYLRPTKRLPYDMAQHRNVESNVLEQSGCLLLRKSMRSNKARVKQRAQAVERAKTTRSRIRNIQLQHEEEFEQRLLCEVFMRTSHTETEARTTNPTKQPVTPDVALNSCLDNLMVSEASSVIFKPEQNPSQPSSEALKSEPVVAAVRPAKKVTFIVTPLCSEEDRKPPSSEMKYGLTSMSRSLQNLKARMDKSRQERREQAMEHTKQARFQQRGIEVQVEEDNEATRDNTKEVSLKTQTPLNNTVETLSPNTDIPKKSKYADLNQKISSLAELNSNKKDAEYQSDHGSSTGTENKLPNSSDDADLLSQLQHLEVSKSSKITQETLQREIMLQLNSNGRGSEAKKPEMKFRFARPKKSVTFSVPDEHTESGEQSNHTSSTQTKNEERRKRREQFFTRAKEARFQNRHIEPHDDDDDSGIDDDDDDDNKPLPAHPTSSTTADKSNNGKLGNSSSQFNSNDKDTTNTSSFSSGLSTSGASTLNNVPRRDSGEARNLDGPRAPMVLPREMTFRYVRPNGRVTFQVAPLVEEGGDAVNCGRSSHVRPSSPHLTVNRHDLAKSRQKRRNEAKDRARLARFQFRGIELEDDDDGEMLQKDMNNISLTMKMIEEQAKKQETKAIDLAKEEVSKNILSKQQTDKQQTLQRQLILQLNSNNKGIEEEPGKVFHFQALSSSKEVMQQLNSNNKGSVSMTKTELKFRFERPRKSVTFILPDKPNGFSSSQGRNHPGLTSSTSLRLDWDRKTRRQQFLERAKHARFMNRQSPDDDSNNDDKIPPPSSVADPSKTSFNQ